jgi:hypothetical protein
VSGGTISTARALPWVTTARSPPYLVQLAHLGHHRHRDPIPLRPAQRDLARALVSASVREGRFVALVSPPLHGWVDADL